MDKNPAQHWINNHNHIVLFDGLCNLCSGWVQLLINRDPKAEFSFCSVQSNEGKALLKSVGLSTDQIETMVYIRSGEVYLRSAAFFEIVKQLPAAWPMLAVGLYLPKGIRDWLYNLIAKNRYRITGKKVHCLIPSEEFKTRFIEWNTTYR